MLLPFSNKESQFIPTGNGDQSIQCFSIKKLDFSSLICGIHSFNFSAMASLGKLSGDIPAVSIGAERLAQGIIARMFGDDCDAHYVALQAFSKPELFGDEWTAEA